MYCIVCELDCLSRFLGQVKKLPGRTQTMTQLGTESNLQENWDYQSSCSEIHPVSHSLDPPL